MLTFNLNSVLNIYLARKVVIFCVKKSSMTSFEQNIVIFVKMIYGSLHNGIQWGLISSCEK